MEPDSSPKLMKAVAEAVGNHIAADSGSAAELEELVDHARSGCVAVASVSQAAWGDYNVQIVAVGDSQISLADR